jgi:hypothetical protein
MKRKLLFNAIAVVLATGGLVACGGGGGDDTTTTSSKDVTTVGTITGFGSVYVNGIEFETDGSSYDVDDDTNTSQSDLAVGMKVKVKGTVNDDGLTGTASSIYYDDDIEGPIDAPPTSIDASTKNFTVLGMTVLADANTTVYDDGAAFDTLAEGQIVEVSGYFDGEQIVATHIELQNETDNEFEIKGTVVDYGTNIGLTLQNGESASYPLSNNVDSEITSASGQFVEVKLKDSGSGLEAVEIELDDEDLLDEDDEDVSIQGVITVDGDVMMINSVPFDVNAGTEYEPASLEDNLAAGMEVEVEGVMVEGVLIAEEVEAETEGEIEIEARVTNVVPDADGINGTVTLTLHNDVTLEVATDSSTLFEDDSSSDADGDGSFTLNDLDTTSDYLEVKAYLNDASDLVASKIKREDSSEATTLGGPVDSFDAGTSITLLSIKYTFDESTTFQVDDLTPTTDSSAFFTGLIEGDTVEILDNEPTDGVADEVIRETEGD